MSEEEFINRIINQISKDYGGVMANELKYIIIRKDKEIEKLEDNWNKLKQWCIESRDTERKEKWNLVKLDKDLGPIIENDIQLYDKMLTVMRDLESKGE